MSPPPTTELVGVLVSRWDFLDALREQPRSKSELETSLGVSRSTVNRAVNELTKVDLIKRVPTTGYRITAFGELIYHLCAAAGECLEGIQAAHALGSTLPTGEYGEAFAFHEAEVIQPGSHDTDRPLCQFLTCLQETDRFKGFSPKVNARYVEVFHDCILNGGMATEIVTTLGVVNVLTATYAEPFSEVLATDEFTMYTVDDQLPFGLTIFEQNGEQQMGLLLYDASGVCGFIRNDSMAAVGWADQLYERYKNKAERINSNKI